MNPDNHQHNQQQLQLQHQLQLQQLQLQQHRQHQYNLQQQQQHQLLQQQQQLLLQQQQQSQPQSSIHQQLQLQQHSTDINTNSNHATVDNAVSTSALVVDSQNHGVSSLLQNLERLEQTGNKFFESLAMVGQGPPSLLAAQLVTMTQICQQMCDVAKSAALQNVPVAKSDDVFSEQSNALPRSEIHEQAKLANVTDLETWVQETVGQTSNLFAERQRVAANVKAALSVPPPQQLQLQNSFATTAGSIVGIDSSS